MKRQYTRFLIRNQFIRNPGLGTSKSKCITLYVNLEYFLFYDDFNAEMGPLGKKGAISALKSS